MTRRREYFCNRCSCERCTAERKGKVDAWPRLWAADATEQKIAILKLLGRLGFGPEHDAVNEFRASWNKLRELDAELTAVEGFNAKNSPLLAYRFAKIDSDLPVEIQTETIKEQICEEIAAAVLPLARITPFTYRGLLTRKRVAEILRRDGHGDLLEGLRRQLERVNSHKTAAVQRLETEKIEILEDGRLLRFVDKHAGHLHEAYKSPDASITPWAVSAEVWRKAFIALAIKHREPGFVLDDIDGSHSHFAQTAKIIGDDANRYSEYMLRLLRALGGDEFDPTATRLPDGHTSLAAKAAHEILEEERESGSWKPRRECGADIGTLKTVPAARKGDWVNGPMSTISQTFAELDELQFAVSEVFETAENMTADVPLG